MRVSTRQPLVPGFLDLSEEELTEKKRDLGAIVAILFSIVVLALGAALLIHTVQSA